MNTKSFVTSDQVNLNYLEAGSGAPLVMLPGWSQTAEQWKLQIETLSANYRCLALDMRGHGASAKPEQSECRDGRGHLHRYPHNFCRRINCTCAGASNDAMIGNKIGRIGGARSSPKKETIAQTGDSIMRTLKIILLAAILATAAVAYTAQIPLDDTRLTIHTMVREDIFAGFLQNDLERLTRAEKNIEVLLGTRPKERPELLAWKGGAMLYRAVSAFEKNQRVEYEQKYKQAIALFAQAQQLAPSRDGVAAVTGGSYVVFGDRLPKEHRAAAWEAAYNAFQHLWKQQGSVIDKLPVHLRGEVLGGLAQAAMRTGRTKEASEMLDKILVVLPGTPYEPIAKQWKANPTAATNSSITCLSCHEPGRLQDRLATLNKPK